jgi:hypothetical protein
MSVAISFMVPTDHQPHRGETSVATFPRVCASGVKFSTREVAFSISGGVFFISEAAAATSKVEFSFKKAAVATCRGGILYPADSFFYLQG